MGHWHVVLYLAIAYSSTVLDYKIKDGTQANAYIGNVGQDAQIDPPNSQRGSTPTYQIVQGNQYLQIGEKSGDLRTASIVDRELLCTEDELLCTIDAEILYINGKSFKLFKVELKIVDLNDNTPIFPASVINLELSEDAAVGTLLRLDSATDADTEEYDIKMYQIDEKSNPKYFELKEQYLPNGKIVPQLKLVRALDYEKRPLHKLKLKAVDQGGLSGSTHINVHVLDVNDHNPQFDSEIYNIKLSESVSVGQVVFTLNATDADSGVFGKVEYSYDTLVTNATRHLFPINSETGEIRIGSALNYEKSKQHNLYVEARDQGQNSIPAYTTITIDIINVNDNRPKIEVSFIGDPLVPSVSESAQIGDFVAFVSVTDDDKGAAGELTAHLIENPDFELDTIDKNSNRYILRTKTILDRERVSQYDLVIEAADSGLPPLVSQEHVLISVLDENDNAPFFPHSMYHVTIKENNHAGNKITTIKARDLDDGINSKITYAFASPSEYFKIDPETGDLFTTQSLDAEQIGANASTAIKVLEIIATDSGMPSRQGRTRITIKISDVNDNVPLFEQGKYHFEIAENKPVGYFVGQVKAVDHDHDAMIRYRFSRSSVPFKINETNGEIRLLNRLDSEIDIALFTLTVIAEDQDGKSDTAHITIRLIDQNDNAPSLVYPLPFKDIIQVVPTRRNGEVIGEIQISDRDQGKNGKVFIVVDRGDDLIKVTQNGTITLTRDIERRDLGPHPVLIRLQDMGEPSLFTTTRINILVAETELTENDFPLMLSRFQGELALPVQSGASKLAVLLIAAFTALVIVLIIITASIFIRHRVRRKEVYRTTDRTPRGPHGDGLAISPGCNSRNEEFTEVAWQVNLDWEKHNGDNYGCTIENSFHSTVDSGRDSGAGDSASDSAPDGREQLPLLEKNRTVYYSPKSRVDGRPTFSTFMDESDGDSIQIIESDEMGKIWSGIEKSSKERKMFKKESLQLQKDKVNIIVRDGVSH